MSGVDVPNDEQWADDRERQARKGDEGNSLGLSDIHSLGLDIGLCGNLILLQFIGEMFLKRNCFFMFFLHESL